jgi:hypothetical protein
VLELISHIVLGYYLVTGVVLLVLLAWGRIVDRRHRHDSRTGDDLQAPTGTEPDLDPNREADPGVRSPDNVVKFNRRE